MIISSSCSHLYVGLTTGLCGSITTFSGVMYNSCLALFGPSSHYTYSASNYLSVIISIFASSYLGFVLGRHLSVVPPLLSLFQIRTIPRCFKKTFIMFLFPLLILYSFLILILLASLLPTDSFTYMIYSLIFAPFGSLTRYLFSILLNTNSNLPWGTLLSNTLGSFLYLGIIALHNYLHISSLLIKQILISLIQGYCGCLTTVSTFILELTSIEKHQSVYIYFLLTVIPVQILFIIFGQVFSSLCSPSS